MNKKNENRYRQIESYIQDGAQSPGGDEYGKSITDPCLGWEKTRDLLLGVADKL